MIFKLMSTLDVKETFVGVLEFIAPEGTCMIPNWLYEQMGFKDYDDGGVMVNIMLENHLPKGTMVKLQPHETAFIDLSDPRAILENELRNYLCLK